MAERDAELWVWLEGGAHFHVCGDAKRMAKDVETALVDIAVRHGGRGAQGAVTFVSQLRKGRRYQADVD